MSNAALETQLWEKVQRAYAASTSCRAGDNADYARALAEFERVAFGERRSNVIRFERGVRK